MIDPFAKTAQWEARGSSMDARSICDPSGVSLATDPRATPLSYPPSKYSPKHVFTSREPTGNTRSTTPVAKLSAITSYVDTSYVSGEEYSALGATTFSNKPNSLRSYYTMPKPVTSRLNYIV
jgi:hypothetical protein